MCPAIRHAVELPETGGCARETGQAAAGLSGGLVRPGLAQGRHRQEPGGALRPAPRAGDQRRAPEPKSARSGRRSAKGPAFRGFEADARVPEVGPAGAGGEALNGAGKPQTSNSKLQRSSESQAPSPKKIPITESQARDGSG